MWYVLLTALTSLFDRSYCYTNPFPPLSHSFYHPLFQKPHRIPFYHPTITLYMLSFIKKPSHHSIPLIFSSSFLFHLPSKGVRRWARRPRCPSLTGKAKREWGWGFSVCRFRLFPFSPYVIPPWIASISKSRPSHLGFFPIESYKDETKVP